MISKSINHFIHLSIYHFLYIHSSIYDNKNDKDIESKIYLRQIKKGYTSALLSASEYFKKKYTKNTSFHNQ